MSIKKLLFLMGFCVLLTGCATTGSSDEVRPGETATETGTRFLLGRGVRQDDAKAFYYFSKAASDGDPFAQNEVAYMYAAGKGTEQDYAKAIKYYQQAANHGLASAQYNLGLLYLHGLGTPPNEALAMEWFRKSASLGFEPAKLALTHS